MLSLLCYIHNLHLHFFFNFLKIVVELIYNVVLICF